MSEQTKEGGFFTATTTAGERCKHLNGWFHSVHFWLFRKYFYVCTDCGDLIQCKKYGELPHD